MRGARLYTLRLVCKREEGAWHHNPGSGERMKKLISAVCFLILALSAVASAAGEGAIHGRITEVRGYLMHDLTVTARNNATGQSVETRTDARGFFQFDHLEAGSYALHSECPNIQEISGHAQVVAGQTEE